MTIKLALQFLSLHWQTGLQKTCQFAFNSDGKKSKLFFLTQVSEQQCEIVHEAQHKKECSNVPERVCRNVPHTVIETVVETKNEEKCHVNFETECKTVTVTKVETVPDQECVTVQEKQCSKVVQNKLDKECRCLAHNFIHGTRIDHKVGLIVRWIHLKNSFNKKIWFFVRHLFNLIFKNNPAYC